MDVITIGETMVLFTPDKPGPIRHANLFTMKFGGAESNVAIGLSRLGHKAGWISRVSDDEFGRAVLSFIRGEGVDVSTVSIDKDHPTGVYFKELRRLNDVRVHYYRKGSAASHLTPDDIDESYISKAKYIHLTGITPALSDSSMQTMERVIEIAKNHHVKVVFDPNYRKKLWDSHLARKTLLRFVSQADIVLPGILEGEFLFGKSQPEEIAKEFLSMGPSLVVLKLGSKGAWYFTKESNKLVPGFQVEQVVDPVGAGDGFAAGFLSGVIRELSIEDAVKIGNAVGALVTMTNGDVEGLPDYKEIESFMGNKQDDVDR